MLTPLPGADSPASARPPLKSGAALSALVLGATVLGMASVFYELSETSPTTGALYRSVWALPALLPLVWAESRRTRGSLRRSLTDLPAVAAGVLLGVDLTFWHMSIDHIGSGLATVLLTTQVVFAGGLAWLFLGERLGRGVVVAIPLILLGSVLAAGTWEAGAGTEAGRGVSLALLASLAYSGYIVLIRVSTRRTRLVAVPIFTSTCATAATALAIGLTAGTVDLTPAWHSQLWLALLALDAQVIGWMLVTAALRALPVISVAASLTIQSVSSVIFAAALLAQRPSTAQAIGSGLVLAGVAAAVARRRAGSAANSYGIPDVTGHRQQLERR